MCKSIAAVIFAASAATASCSQSRAEEGGPTVSRNYPVGNFQQIEVAGPYEVDVHTGANPGVSARGPQKMLEHAVVEVRGDKLVIHPERHNGLFNMSWSGRGTAKFTVTVPQLSGATMAGSGDIRVDQVRGNSFEGAIAGSGSVTLGNVAVQEFKGSIGGSGDLKAAGQAQTADYDIGGSGGIEAGNLAVQQARVSIAGSGSVTAHASGTADVSIMGSGDVEIGGGAKCNVRKMGSGSVNCS